MTADWTRPGSRRQSSRAGGHWLEDKPLRWAPNAVAYGNPQQELWSADCQVLCIHHPGPPAARQGFDLILSGHLHGGQFVFYERGGKLYPGAFAYRWNGLRFQENGHTLLVSRGVRDTLPLRWNCPARSDRCGSLAVAGNREMQG